MKLVQLGSFANTLACLNSMLIPFKDGLAKGHIAQFKPDSYCALIKPLKVFQQTLRDLGMTVCAGVAKELITHYGAAKDVEGNMRWTDLGFRSVVTNIDTLNLTLGRELSTKKLYVMNPAEVAYLNLRDDSWGVNFENRFQSLAFDLEQSHRCIAFGQPTAAVFHLMRILEGGLKALSRSLGVSDPISGSRDWGSYLKEIREQRNDRTRKLNGAKWKNKQDEQFFAECYGLLDAARIAWRNRTMHLDKKYDPDDAERIYNAMKGFMAILAVRMDDRGRPLA